MNNEWNINLLQDMSSVEKESTLKLYLPGQKWTMNETLICFKIWALLKKNQHWNCICQDWNEQWIKRLFVSKYELCWKRINTEAVFARTEMIKEWNINLFQNMSCVEKKSTLKLYLPGQKWNMNETLIFSKKKIPLAYHGVIWNR